MKTWLRRVRGAVLMGLTWAVTWAIVAVLIGLIVDPDGSMDEMWPAIGAYPGFLGGVAFAGVLGIVGRRHRFDELSLPRFAAWGAAAGLMVGALPFVLGDPTSEIPVWLMALVLIGSITVLSAVSAAVSLALARASERRELLAVGMGSLASQGETPEFTASRPFGDTPRGRAHPARDPGARG